MLCGHKERHVYYPTLMYVGPNMTNGQATKGLKIIGIDTTWQSIEAIDGRATSVAARQRVNVQDKPKKSRRRPDKNP